MSEPVFWIFEGVGVDQWGMPYSGAPRVMAVQSGDITMLVAQREEDGKERTRITMRNGAEWIANASVLDVVMQSNARRERAKAAP